MCGVFGFVAKEDGKLNMKILTRVARITERRGPHAWGLAWINSKGQMCSYKQTGSIRDSLGLLAMAEDARLLIGHTRWATQGDPEDNNNNHPHQCGTGFIVHNGMIPSYRSIIAEHGLHPQTDCDSEVLALLIAQQAKQPLLKTCVKAAEIAGERALVMLGLWPGKLVAIRKGNPLQKGETKRGIYLASLAAGLPGKVSEMQDNWGVVFGLNA